MKKDVIGAVINVGFVYVTVSKVIYSDYWDRFGWDIEFLDENGKYRHWKQWDDGGTITFPSPIYTDCYGVDCSDIFRKYGYIK